MFYILYGEIPKRLKGSVLKTERRLTTVRGFKSLFLRQIKKSSDSGRLFYLDAGFEPER